MRAVFSGCKADDQILLDPECMERTCGVCGVDEDEMGELGRIFCPTCLQCAKDGSLPDVEVKLYSEIIKTKKSRPTDIDPEFAPESDTTDTGHDFLLKKLTVLELADTLKTMIHEYLQHHSYARWQQADSKVMEAPPAGCIVIKSECLSTLLRMHTFTLVLHM